MGYAEHNLISGEVITYRGKLHSVAMTRSIAIGAILAILGIVFIGFAISSSSLGVHAALAFLMIVAAAAIIATAVMKRNAAEFVITNRRVIIKLGIMHKHTTEMFLQKIESVDVEQSVAARMAGYGNITLRGTGGTSERFEKIANPLEFRRQIQEQIGRSMATAGTN